METLRRDPVDDDEDKLIPEWGARADDQIIWAGMAVFAAVFLLLFGWDWFQGDDETGTVAIGTTIDGNGGGNGGDDLVPAASAAVATDGAIDAVETATTVTTAPATTTTEPSTTTTEVATTTPSGPDLDALTAAISPEPGDITAVVVGSAVTLTGFVADGTEETAAIEAASAVAEVESVTSELVLLEPAVAQVLADQGVVVATVDGTGTEITVSGTLQSEANRAPTIAAAEAVEGVTSIIDQLDVSVADALNELPTIPFATGSATILPEGQAIVAEAATLINSTDGAVFDVQGYTDITGDADINLELSEARARAVLQALVTAGVDPGNLTATGFGETEEFGEGVSPEALAANRVVLFVQTG